MNYTTDRRTRRTHHVTTQTVPPRLQAGNSQADGGAGLHPCASLRGRWGGRHRRETLAQQTLAEQAGTPLPKMRALTPEIQEIQQLKQRIKQLETSIDILKKARGIEAWEMR